MQLAARELEFRPAVATIDDQFPVLDHPRRGLRSGVVFLATEKLRGVLAVENDDRIGRRIAKFGPGSHHRRCRAGDIVHFPFRTRDERRVGVADGGGLVVVGGEGNGNAEQSREGEQFSFHGG